MKWCTCYLMIFSCVFLPLLGYEVDRNYLLEQCLVNDWGVDPHTVEYLKTKFQSLNELSNSIIDDFITKSKNLNIDYAIPRDVKALSPSDAILSAPNHHLVIFENLYVRILWGSTPPKDREPFHMHQYKSLLVVFKPTPYEIEYPDGKIDIWNGEVGVFELPPNDQYSCTNIGNNADEMIRFEVKE